MQGIPLQAFMQGFQPPQVVFTGNPFMPIAPQYPMMAPMMPPQAQFPAPADQPWFQALVAAVSKAVIQDIKKLNAPPAAAPAEDHLSAENEKILIDALKKGKEENLPMERIFQDLCKKHGYTETAWMKWFAMNVDKLYPKLALPKASSERGADSNPAGSVSNGLSNQAPLGTRSASSNRPSATFRFVPEQQQARSRKVVITAPKPPASNSTQAKSTPAASARAAAALSSSNGSSTNSAKPPSNPASRQPVTQSASSAAAAARTPYSANRSKRGGSVPIVHDQTIIPWSDGSTKPSAPRSDSPAKPQLPRRTSTGIPKATAAVEGNELGGSKPTEDEKIFFVHWLRWRLRARPLPDKETLYDELEAELPHRPAETWRKHWASNCEVPDALYIAARKRVDAEAWEDPGPRGESPLTPLAARDTSSSESSSEHESEPESDEEQSAYHPASASARKPGPATLTNTNTAMKTTPKSGRVKTARSRVQRDPSRPQGGVPVTDSDLRAMARYKFKRGGEWADPHVSHKAFWHDFAHRPENGKRSWDGWNSAARGRHLAVIDRYVRELERQAAAATLPSTTLPSSTMTSKPAAPPAASAASSSLIAPQQNRPVPLTAALASKPSSGAASKSKQLGDAKTSPPSPQKRAAAEVEGTSGGVTASGAAKELPPLKRKKTGWDHVDPAEIVDLTGDSD